MSYPVSAIEQEHNGYLFRSRLEARWSEFFKQAGLPVYYEYQGYDLGDGIWYLPDYYIPKWKCYLEVKDASLVEEARREEWLDALEKAWLLRDQADHKVIVTFGGFGSEEELMAVFMPGDLEPYSTPQSIIFGYGKFGSCNGADVLYIHTKTTPKEIEGDVAYLSQYYAKELAEGRLGDILDRFQIWATSRYLIPLHSSVGFNFAVTREWTGKKTLALFSDPLFCSYNAQFFSSFKPYAEAYKAAKQLRFEHKNGRFSSNVL